MSRPLWRARNAPASILIALLLTASQGAAVGADSDPQLDDASTRETMRAIFAGLQTLLPAAVSDTLGDPKRTEEFGAAFELMGKGADRLATHGSPLVAGSRLFADSLAQDIRRAEAFFERGNFDGAAFFVTSVVEDCTACHTRQKSTDANIARDFVKAEAITQLGALEQARIAVATRRFAEGLTLYEGAFAETDAAPEVLLAPLTNYLTTALRVTREPARAAATVAKLRAKPEISGPVEKDLKHWEERLRATKAEDLRGTTLEDAREAMSRATSTQRFQGDRRALIEFLVASSKLHDLSEKPQPSPDDVAEVFELLGLAEFGIAQNMWSSHADLHWENAIRIAPGTATSRRAFALLEREVQAGFTGSSGLHLPDDEAARLEELRALVGSEPLDAGDGAKLFARHCALCHANDATGYGPLAPELQWRPADLTRIATRHGGVFPEDEIFRLIARRDPLGSHRSPEMPRWGDFWSDDSKIDALVEYLRGIQKP